MCIRDRVRGVVSLPHGTGKVTRVLVLCTPDAEAAAKEAGADYVGLDEYIEKITETLCLQAHRARQSVIWYLL